MDIDKSDFKIMTHQSSVLSPTKFHDSEDPFYDKIRSRHPRSLNYNDHDIESIQSPYVDQKSGENLAVIKAIFEENKYRPKNKMKMGKSEREKQAILNEIHNMRMQVFDDRQPANNFEN